MRVRQIASCSLPAAILLGAIAASGGSETNVPTTMAITATDYAFSGVPDTTEAGIVQVKLRNAGRTRHEAWFLKVREGTSVAAVIDSLPAINRGEPFPSFMLAATGVHPVESGKTTTSTFNLTPGHWFVLCDESTQPGTHERGKPHFQRGMIVPLEVTGTGGMELPAAEDTLTARDYAFDTSQLTAGRHTVLFWNAGPDQWHFAVILEFPRGTTTAQAGDSIAKAFKLGGPPRGGLAGVKVLSIAEAASPGYGNTFTTNFTKGRVYVVADFMSDRAGGPPHAIGHHMWKVFTVQ